MRIGRTDCVAALLATTVALLVPAVAGAAVPSAGTDMINANPAGTVDVLANDSDADGPTLTVVSQTDPAHGTASCTALGACLYVATGGYVGADTFTYTVRDPDSNDTVGTVNVNVTAQS